MKQTINKKEMEVPEGWKVTELRNLVKKVGSGKTPLGGEKIYKANGRMFLRSQNVDWGHLLLDNVAFIDEETHNTFKSSELKFEDVLLNITGASIGRSAVATNDVVGGNVNQHVCIIRTKQEKLDPYYLNAFLLSHKGQHFIDSFQSGGNRQGLNFEQIKSFKLPLPPLSEQKAIAQVLTTADKNIALTDRLIEQKEKQKKWLMQMLLTGTLRLRSASGEKFSGEWKEVRLGESIKLQGGYAFKSNEFKEEGIPIIRISNIQEGKIDISNSVYYDEIPISKNFIISNGDILIAMSGATTGKIGIYNSMEIAYLNQRVGSFKLIKSHFYKPYLQFFVYSEIFKKIIYKDLEQGAQPNISPSFFSSVKVEIPSLEEQTAIANILQTADKEIEILKAKAEQLRMQKKWLMQVLLTGRKRIRN